jgi:membrane protein implicated in regulation of membrane protease activity
MTLDTLIMLAGTLVALLPFLGLPTSWDTIIFFVLGILVIALGIAVRRRTSREARPTSHLDDSPTQ